MAILREQKAGNDCGPTCFANTLNLLGYDIKIEKANKLCGLRREGTDSFDLIKAFDRYGFQAEEKEVFSERKAWNWIARDTNKGLPVIISVDEDTHWLLVIRAGKKSAQIFDPSARYPEKVNKKDLLARWKYFDEDYGDKERYHGLELFPYREKAIKAVIIREKLLQTSNV